MKYPVNEIFKSRQGEGYNVGKEAVFVRLAGCNLSCPWCDTDHVANSIVDSFELVHRVKAHHCPSVIITGGEPTLQPLDELSFALRRVGIKWIGIETNGTTDVSPFRGLVDYISESPKRDQPMHDSTWNMVDELRVVNDGVGVCYFDRFAAHGARHRFISPMSFLDGSVNLYETIVLLSMVNERNAKPWYLSQQTHKTLKIR